MSTENPFDPALSDENLPDFVQDGPEIVPEVTPPESPTPVEAPESEVPEVEVADEEVVSEAPEAEEPPTKAWAGKYQSPEELERGYRELRDLQRRTAERAKAHEQRNQEIEARARQLEDALRRAIPYVQQAMQRPASQEDPYSVETPQPQLTREMLGPMVQQQVDAGVQKRLQEYQAYQQQVQAQQQEYNEAASQIKTFFEAHPEVVPGGDLDQDIAETITALNEAWEPTGSQVDIASPEALEIAYEASKRPALRQVLEINPAYIDTDAGMTLARKLASEIDGITQGKPVQGRDFAPRANTPVVERGSSQAPQPGVPLDEFEQAAAEYHKQIRARGSEVFFGG